MYSIKLYLSKLWEIVEDKERSLACCSPCCHRVRNNLVTKQHDAELICIYTHQQRTSKEEVEENSIHNNIKKNKMLRNKLNQRGKRSVCTKDYKTLKLKDTKRWKNTLCSWIR